MKTDEQTRQHETSITIDAPPETVWKAVTDAGEIVRWFAYDAKVVPGEGGSIWLSWGPGMEGTSRIEVWEPEVHLRAVNERGEGAAPAQIAVDYFLQAQGGSTVLRVVHSGFGMDSDWDEEYNGTRRGWPVFLRTLKLAVERHAGKPNRNVMVHAPLTVGLPEAWERLMGPDGLCAEGRLEGLRPGDRYDVRTAEGTNLSGVVEILQPPATVDAGHAEFSATLNELDDALLWLSLTNGDTGSASLMLITYGAPAEQVDQAQQQFEALFGRLFSAA